MGRRPNSVAGVHDKQQRRLQQARNSNLSQVEQQIKDYLKCDMELSAFFINHAIHTVPSTGRNDVSEYVGN